MIMRLTIITATIFALSAGAAFAQQNVKGAGALTCNELDQMLIEADESDQAEIVTAIFSWAQGYFSGKNLERPLNEQKELLSMDPQPLVQKIADICLANRSLYLYEVADQIYQTLPGYRRNQV